MLLKTVTEFRAKSSTTKFKSKRQMPQRNLHLNSKSSKSTLATHSFCRSLQIDECKLLTRVGLLADHIQNGDERMQTTTNCAIQSLTNTRAQTHNCVPLIKFFFFGFIFVWLAFCSCWLICINNIFVCDIKRSANSVLQNIHQCRTPRLD